MRLRSGRVYDGEKRVFTWQCYVNALGHPIWHCTPLNAHNFCTFHFLKKNFYYRVRCLMRKGGRPGIRRLARIKFKKAELDNVTVILSESVREFMRPKSPFEFNLAQIQHLF